MKYLDCIELLRLALQVLKEGKRDQVPISKVAEVQTLVLRCMDRCRDLPLISTRCEDVLLAANLAQSNKSLMCLTNTMRDALVRGVRACLSGICEASWDYYMENDVMVTNETEPLLRTIVVYHYLGEGE